LQRKKTGRNKSSPSKSSNPRDGRKGSPGAVGKARAKRSVPKRAAAASSEAPAKRGAPKRAAAVSPEALSERARSPARTRQVQATKVAAEAAIEAALDKKALLPVLLDVSARASYTDFIGIVSGRSDRQVDAIAEHVIRALHAKGWQLLGREGNGNGRWTLLDFGDIVLHVFFHPVREFYDIESLWIDAPRVKLTVPPEAAQLREESLFYEQP
jgi:ribosome-associated protein